MFSLRALPWRTPSTLPTPRRLLRVAGHFRTFRTLAALALLIGAAWALRAPFLQRELWNLDEGSTFTMAEQVLHGDVLYRDATDNRSPLVPYLKAAVFAVAGEWNFPAQHLALALALGVCAFLLAGIARQFGDGAAGRWSAAVFTVTAFALPGPLESFGAHTEWYLVLFSTLGFWLLAHTYRRGGGLAGLAVGVVFGASALCKQPGLLDFGVAWVVLGLIAWFQPARRDRLARYFLGALGGCAAVFAGTGLYFAVSHAWRDFVYYAFTYNAALYVPAVPFSQRLATIAVPWHLLWHHLPSIAVFALLGVGGLLRLGLRQLRWPARGQSPLPWLILGWLATGLIATTLSGRGFEHYSIQAIPAFSLAAGWTLARIAAWTRPPLCFAIRRSGLSCLLLAITVLSTGSDVVRFSQAVKPADDPADRVLRELVARYTAPSERIFIWGYFPEGYAISRRLPATRFIYTNFLTGLIPWANVAPDIDTRYAVVPGAWDAFWSDYTRRPPRLIVDAALNGYLKYPLLSQPRLRDEIIDHFAEIEPTATRRFSSRVLLRLAPLAAASIEPAPPLNGALSLFATREPLQRDLILVSVSAPAGTRELTLCLGGRPYRRLVTSPETPVEARFTLRLGDLAAPGAATVDVIAQTGAGRSACAPLDVAKYLLLDLRPVQPTPELSYGTRSLAPDTPADPSAWHPESRGNLAGWSTAAGFTLTFTRPPALQILQFTWQGPVGETALPGVSFTGVGRSAERLPVQVHAGPGGLREVIAALPRADLGRVSLVWTGSRPVWLGSLQGYAHGPWLRFGDRFVAPSLAIQETDHPLAQAADGSWEMHSYSRLLYPREPEMEGFVLSYGLRESDSSSATARPVPPAILEVNFLHEDGRSENLRSRLLDPSLQPGDRGLQTSRFTLPSRGSGEIEIKFVAPNATTPSAPAYVFPPRAQGAGPDLTLSADRVLVPLESQIFGDDRIHAYASRGWTAHAPSRVVYACPADLRAITFGFGLEEGAYHDEQGSPRSDGVEAVVEFVAPDGAVSQLYRRQLTPFGVASDRGPQTARVELPGREGRLVIRLTPGPRNDPSFDWAYLTEITGEVSPSRRDR